MVGSPSLPARKSVTPTIAAPSNALLAYLDALVVPSLSAKALTLCIFLALPTSLVAIEVGTAYSVNKEVRFPAKLSGLSSFKASSAISSIFLDRLVSRA